MRLNRSLCYRPSNVTASLHLGALSIEGTWNLNDSERCAAWEMYVELATRVSLAELSPGEGLLREALSSLHTLFGATREILREHGPIVAQPKGDGRLSFGYLAIAVLNHLVRPVLAKWHPLLLDYESTRPDSVSSMEHEMQWPRNQELRSVLSEVRCSLARYANLLAEAANVPPLIP